MTQLKNVEADQSGTVIQRAMARYDYIFAKYGTALTLTNTLDRTITPMSSFVLIAREANSTLLLVVISSVSAISLVGLFLILKKKKHN